MTVIERKVLISELKKKGFEYKRTKGSHEIWDNGKKIQSIPKKLSPVIARRIAIEEGVYNLVVKGKNK